MLLGPCLVSLVDVSPEYLHSLKQHFVLSWHSHSSGMEADGEVTDVSFRSGRFPSGSSPGSVVTLLWRRQLEK